MGKIKRSTHRAGLGTLYFILCTFFSYSQQRETDSLIKLIRAGREDTNTVNALNALAAGFMYSNPDTSILLSSQALALSQKIGFEIGIGRSAHRIGTFHFLQGDYRSAIDLYTKAMSVWDKLQKGSSPAFKKYILNLRSKTLGNIGLVYRNQSDYPRALRYYLEAEKLYEELDLQYDMAANLGNIGVIYETQHDFPKALDHYDRSLKIARHIGNANLEAVILGDIGIVYEDQLEHDSAVKYYSRSLEIYERSKNLHGMATQLSNLGVVYEIKKDFDRAISYYKEAFEKNKATGNKSSMVTNLGNLGSVYAKSKNYKLAEAYTRQAIEQAYSIHYLEAVCSFEKNYSSLDSLLGNFNGALEHYKKYISARDSITNDANIKKQTQLEMQFDFDKKQAADSVKVAEEKKVVAAELKSERNQRYSLYGGLALVLVFAGAMYNRFRVTQKQKTVIEEQKVVVEEQKQIVEEKNKDILDSIYYARRIQRALLPSEKYISKILNGK